MDKKATGIVSYLTLIGWLIAFLAGDKEGAKFHLNQSLVLLLANVAVSIFYHVPYIGHIISPILNIVLFVFWIIGFIYACEDKEQEIPLIGGIKILN